MKRLRAWGRRLVGLFRSKQADAEFAAELESHLQFHIDDNLRNGMTQTEARRQALIKLGGLEQIKETYRDRQGWPYIEDVWQDLRFAARMLGKNPAFTMVAVVTLALGVGINVGIFSVLNGAALRLLPIPRAQQIVSLHQIFHGHFRRNVHGEGSMFSYPEYLEYRDHNRVFSGLLAYEPDVEATLVRGRTVQLLGAATSCNYFDVLSERPRLGRGFVDSDCAAPGQNAVVVLSDGLWRGTFASDPALLGKAVTLNRIPYIVIGITPPGFTGTELTPSAFWVPLTMQAALDGGDDRLKEENLSWLVLLGRTRTGLTLDHLRADLGVIAARVDRLYPGRSTSLAIHTATFLRSPEEREVLLPIASAILVAFGLVLLMACANVANLLLARASVRHNEIALRLSIGASRWRLVRQLLTESVLLSLMGGILGSLLALGSFVSITTFVTSHLPPSFPTFAVNVAPDAHVFGYALALTLLTGIAFGLVPALETSRLDLHTALKGEGRPAGDEKTRGRFVRNTLVGAQIVVSMVLLLGAGLLLRGLYYAQTVDPGFEMRNVAAMPVNLRAQGYDESRGAVLAATLRERIAGLPSVIEVAQAECAPLSHEFSSDHFIVPGRADRVLIEFNRVSPQYFSVVGIPIVRGRGFAPGERRNAPGVIVTESTAKQLWPGQDPLAKTLLEGNGRQYSVIGVARDAQVSHLGELHTNYLYFPAGPEDNLQTYLLVRFTGSFAATAKGIRETAESLDAELPREVIKLEDYLEVWRTPSRIVAGLSAVLGALALLLAAIGVYGMVSCSVSRRVHEIGIRMTLGAKCGEIVKLVLRQAMRPVLIGGLVGLIGSAAVSWVLSSLLFGLSAHDPVAFLVVPLFLLVVALMASYLPARRAARLDPMNALRYE